MTPPDRISVDWMFERMGLQKEIVQQAPVLIPRTTKNELVAVGIFKNSHLASGLVVRLVGKLDTAALKLIVSLIDVIASEDYGGEGSHAVFHPRRGPKGQMSLSARRSHFYPTSLRTHRCVRDQFKAKSLGVKVERPILIGHANPY